MTVSGLGNGIVECLRIAQLIERHGDRFLSRVFTPREIQYCSSRSTTTQHYAGRWAAKEAVLKAMGIQRRRNIQWQDIEVRIDPSGQLRVALAGEARTAFQERGLGDLVVTIAHCRTHATATVIAVERESDAY